MFKKKHKGKGIIIIIIINIIAMWFISKSIETDKCLDNF